MNAKTWVDRTEHYLQVAALLFLAGFAAPIIEPGLPAGWKRACSIVVGATWAIFGIDYLVRLLLAHRRGTWFLKNLFSLILLIVPLLRPLQLLRLVTLMSVLNRTARVDLRRRVALYAAGGVVLLVFCGALGVTAAERGRPGSMISNFGDAVWWALETITTVGYGDMHPVTVTGRIVAAIVMLGGIALLGTVSGMFASWLIEQIRASGAARTASSKAHPSIAAELASLGRLYNRGVLTAEEFATAKTTVLSGSES